MAYASAADWIARVDTQIIADLVTDDDPETGERTRPTREELIANEIVGVLLADASGRIDAALMAGGKYTPAQLAALAGNSQSHLKRITCIIATALAFDRRPEQRTQEIADRYREQADKLLLAIQKGQDIFGLADNTDVNAGLMSTHGPTALEIINRNLLPERMGRHLPGPAQRNPLN
jgi:phage gp36-like protein